MRVALAGAELEENLALRYLAASLEAAGHECEIVPFNTEHEVPEAVEHILSFSPVITGLSMIFTGRGREFIRLAQELRRAGYPGHIVGGGPFASFNCTEILRRFPEFDSIALGEGEELMVRLAAHLDDPSEVSGLCYRARDGSVQVNPSPGNPENLDALPFPKRINFHRYFDKPIASILTSRGCWRECAFCSINAWYQRSGGHKFRTRTIDNIVAEMKQLYFDHGVRIFNFQDDNFFLPNPPKAAARFRVLRERLEEEGVRAIACAVKCRPDSVTEPAIAELDQLGLFRVFLGVENASQEGLHHLNRKNTVAEILSALDILNRYDIHVAYNLLMFEPETTMEDLALNLRFMERHNENPANFCRAEAYPGTGLETKLLAEGRLLGDIFGYDYRLKDPRCEAFHQVTNYAFFDRNFNDLGLHYFNMQVDFYFQLLRRFHPQFLTHRLRAAVRNFIKQTNLDTYECLAQIYDFIEGLEDPRDMVAIKGFAQAMRNEVDARSEQLRQDGERILKWLEDTYATQGHAPAPQHTPHAALWPAPAAAQGFDLSALLGAGNPPIPYSEFAARLAEANSGNS
jgi:anaerobic magnesium-protoporphyrin IX monomethyl ester cyclase